MRRNEDKLTISVIGAAGKMGSRIANKLLKTGYNILLCEEGGGIAKLREKGLSNIEITEAVSVSDVVIMAVPDSKIGEISSNIVPLMKKDATMILLDPAAAYAGELALRDDCTFVVTHPCHPSVFREWDTLEAHNDLFGGVAAKQDVVIALLQGTEKNFQKGQQICVEMFAPVAKCHRITVGQMAILEPVMTEVVAASAICVMKEAVEEAIKYGVPEEAAKAFMLGHIQVQLAIVFGRFPSKFSDAANVAVKCGYDRVFKSDWKEVFKPEAVKEIVHEMLHPRESTN